MCENLELELVQKATKTPRRKTKEKGSESESETEDREETQHESNNAVVASNFFFFENEKPL